MRNDSGDPVRIGRAAKLYQADPGETIDVYRVDVLPMRARGFVVVRDGDAQAAPSEETTEDDLDELTLDELTGLARERDLSGRSKLNRGELIAALRAHE